MFQGSNEWRSFRGLVLTILGETLKVYNGARRNITGLNLYCDGGWQFDAELLSGQKHAVNTLDSNRRRPIWRKE